MNWNNVPAAGPDTDPISGSFIKLSSINNPSPSQAAVFLEEASTSIDNNAIGIFGVGASGFWNPPSSRHNKGMNHTFADGHAEYRKWKGDGVVRANAIADPVANSNDQGPGWGYSVTPVTASDRIDLDYLASLIPQ